MSNLILEVDSISKMYKLGAMNARTFRESITNYFSKAGDVSSNGKNVLWALNDVSFKMYQGETLGIIGHNGAGKSTMLKLLSQITSPTTGRMKVRGHIASLIEVGTGFHNELTGRENIYLNGAILGMKRMEIVSVISEIIEFSEISLPLIDTPIKKYSSGMKVRLAFSVAVFLKASILLLDEVLAVSDYKFQEKSLSKLKELVEKGKSIIYVSHDLEAIRSLCSKCILLENGKLIMQGTSDEVIQYYLEANSLQTNDSKINIGFNLGFLRIDSITIKSCISKNQLIKVGDGINISFTYLVDENLVKRNRKLGFKLLCYSESGELLFATSKKETVVHDILSNSLSMSTSALNLLEGNYYFTLLISFGNENHKIDEFVKFTINSSNNLTLLKEGLLNVEAQWEMNSVHTNDMSFVK